VCVCVRALEWRQYAPNMNAPLNHLEDQHPMK
jgi:hypothetical protein